MKRIINKLYVASLAVLVTMLFTSVVLAEWKGAPIKRDETNTRAIAPSGTRGIVMDTCRELEKKPIRMPGVNLDTQGRLLLSASGRQSIMLPDGVYIAKNGIRLHFKDGRLTLVDGIKFV